MLFEGTLGPEFTRRAGLDRGQRDGDAHVARYANFRTRTTWIPKVTSRAQQADGQDDPGSLLVSVQRENGRTSTSTPATSPGTTTSP